MKVVCALLAFCSALIASAPASWWRAYGGTNDDGGYSVQQTTDGGYIVAGYSSSLGASGSDVYVIRTNPQGDALWTKRYGGSKNDGGYSVQQTMDGGYIIAGRTFSFGTGLFENVYLVKIDVRGETLWTRTYGGPSRDIGRCVRQTTDGGYVVAGTTTSFGPAAPGYSIYVIKTDAQGDTLWTRSYGGTEDYLAFSIQQTTDGGYIIAGDCGNVVEPNSADICLIKTNSSGDKLWTRTYGGARDDRSRSVQEVADGGYLVVGATESFGAGGGDVYLVRTNAFGDIIWTRTYGGRYGEFGYCVQQTNGGGCIIAGYTYSFGAGTPRRNNVYLVGIDAVGDTRWTRAYGGTGYDEGRSVQQTTDGDYIITGLTAPEGGSANVSLIKTGLSRDYRADR